MKIVLSASRRTDLVGSYPDAFVQLLEAYPAEKVHSIVLWSKNARNLVQHHALRETLSRYDQLFLQFSITGMGQSLLEPGIPSTRESLAMLPELIRLVQSTDRISVRFDPVVNLVIQGKPYTNLDVFPTIAREISRLGIRRVTTSWMATYPKVERRFQALQIQQADYDFHSQASFLQEVCEQHGLQLHACCVEGLPMSRCIDGPVLQALHPRGERCSQAKATGQRPLCGCTASRDIGWYSQICGGRCRYCYASPAEVTVERENSSWERTVA